MIRGIFLIVHRECLLTWRHPAEWINPLLFFILVSVLFPLTVTPSGPILQSMGPGVLWIAMLLAVLLSLPRLFQPDYEDGSLEQWILSPYPLPLLILAKLIAHWLMLCIPVLVITPLLALMYHLTTDMIAILMLTLLLGTPLLILLGAVGAALLVSVRQSGLLLALILLPLYIPPLIFATSALNAVTVGFSPAGAMAWLGALLSLAIVLAPGIAAITLRMGIAYR